ncbi:hypothetical protein [Flexivirga meconopsidis]|uniref:hypothetical protein n=1 Tax=Flexivirga meconopsidis TaxID=2977121 RepID=UPI0022403E09|nr:hypothetical protein [Flexivirga meconopsidis]
MTSTPESIEDYYARVAAATDDEGRLPVAVEEMPGWDIFPFETESLRIKPLQPLADAEPDRRGEDPATCDCAGPDSADDGLLVWSNDRWRLTIVPDTGLPVVLSLGPKRHMDLPTMPADWAAEFGRLIATISAGIEALPSVGRAQIAKYGDGGAHLHLWLFGRPARMLQLRGSPLLDWEENLPRVPRAVAQANARPIGEALVPAYGGAVGRLDG